MRSFRSSAEQLLHQGQALGVRHMLLNMNTLPDISVYDQVWLGLQWTTRLLEMPLERVVLVNHRRRVHNQLAIESLIAMVRPLIRFDIQYFPQVAPGLHWLSDYSPRIAALLAEWDAWHGLAPLPATGVNEPRAKYNS